MYNARMSESPPSPANDPVEIPPRATVHAVCKYVTGRDLESCRKCPPWEIDPKHGFFRRGCYGLAQEVVNIAQTGDAWRRFGPNPLDPTTKLPHHQPSK